MKNLFFFFAISSLFFACVKDPLATNNNHSNNTPTTPNACPGADGALWAVKSITSQQVSPSLPSVSITVGTGIGFFSSNGLSSNPMNRVDVGSVTVNSNAMEYIGETYIATASASTPTGIDWSNGVTWEVSGGNGFGAFTHTPTNAFPTASEITSPDVVTKASGYTLSCDRISGADSVLFLVGGIHKTLGPSNTSCTFTSSELNTLETGTQLVQIVPYTMSSALKGGKTICFGKEMVQQLSVTVQ